MVGGLGSENDVNMINTISPVDPEKAAMQNNAAQTPNNPLSIFNGDGNNSPASQILHQMFGNSYNNLAAG